MRVRLSMVVAALALAVILMSGLLEAQRIATDEDRRKAQVGISGDGRTVILRAPAPDDLIVRVEAREGSGGPVRTYTLRDLRRGLK